MRGIVYDFDNTLVTTNEFVREHIIETVKDLFIDMPDDEMLYSILKKNLPFEKVFDELFGEKGPKVLKAYRETTQTKSYSATVGALKFVEQNSLKKIKQIILTNRLNLLEERLRQAGFNPDHFYMKLAPEKDASKKPDGRVYTPILAEFSASELLSIGDHVDDYTAAKGNQIDFYAILAKGSSTKNDFLNAGLEKAHICNNFHEVTERLYG